MPGVVAQRWTVSVTALEWEWGLSRDTLVGYFACTTIVPQNHNKRTKLVYVLLSIGITMRQ
jgi:hypothetical protein